MKHIGPIILLLLISCKEQDRLLIKEQKFSLPVVIQSDNITDSIIKPQPHFLISVWAPFIGKFKFADTIRITEKRDTSIRKDFIGEFYDGRLEDSLKHDGFQIATDYNRPILLKDNYSKTSSYFYPVFIVNETKSTKIFMGKDSYVFAIQEAKDTTGSWHPIEMRGFDFCGNGYWGLKVNPNEFAAFLLPVYNGNHETDIRVRIKIGNSIYVSTPFKGLINLDQFIMHPEWPDRKFLKEHKAEAIMTLFYGASPKNLVNNQK